MPVLLWCDSAGCGCRWGDSVVSQLFANSRAPHSGRGQVQEPGVDQQQDHCGSEMFLLLSCLCFIPVCERVLHEGICFCNGPYVHIF